MSQDASRAVVISNPQGLHLRPAHGVVTLASGFQAAIQVSREDGEVADGKSMLSLFTLGAAEGTQLVVRAIGEDADSAVQELADFLEKLEDLNIDEGAS